MTHTKEKVNEKKKENRVQLFTLIFLQLLLSIVLYDRVCLHHQWDVLGFVALGAVGLFALIALVRLISVITEKGLNGLQVWPAMALILIWFAIEFAIFATTIYWSVTSSNIFDAMKPIGYELLGFVLCLTVSLLYDSS
uniref:Uncharacterized protein n=1 Tax=Acrobeloides nanus TaxID=290746 RepID=A0A914CYR0_9BILA